MRADNKASLRQRQQRFLRAFNDNLCRLFAQNICAKLDVLVRIFLKDAKNYLAEANLKRGAEDVSEAFAKALKAAHEKVQKNSRIIRVRHGKAETVFYQYDVRELDRLTLSAFKRDAVTGKRIRKTKTLSGGWWRVFEFGSPKSKSYGFIPGKEERGGWMSNKTRRRHPGIPRIRMLHFAWEKEKGDLAKLQFSTPTPEQVNAAWRMTVSQEGEFPCY